jgi:hypothetical protein
VDTLFFPETEQNMIGGALHCKKDGMIYLKVIMQTVLKLGNLLWRQNPIIDAP